jgi:hypothetical protein
VVQEIGSTLLIRNGSMMVLAGIAVPRNRRPQPRFIVCDPCHWQLLRGY